MLYTYYSNRLEALASSLVAVLDQPSAEINPLEPLTVLVQSSGMARWLSLQFARQAGVCANVRFPFVASFVWEIYRAQFPQLPVESKSDKPILLWRLMALFETPAFCEKFPELAAYLAPSQPMLKRYQLAGQIADVFDQYLIYRPEWMTEWAQGREQHWQARLWRILVQDAPRDDPDRAQIQRDVLARAAAFNTAGLPKRLAVIGISSLPRAYLALLDVLSRHVDVHVFVLNPAVHYWSDIESPRRIAARARQQDIWGDAAQPGRYHALLASMGRQGQEFIDLLQEFPADETAVFVDPARHETSLLATLQRDVLLLQQSTVDKTASENNFAAGDFSTDQSIRIASCHSIVRELEVLHDALLDYFSQHPRSRPDDIVVMVPAIDDYAPFIQAVFGSQPEARRLPFTVSDRAATSEDALLNCFLQLLDLPERRFAHSAVVEILRNDAVQQRYGFEDFDALLDLIERSQIRWGLDESAWSFVAAANAQNTWSFGLSRLFAGYAYGEPDGDFSLLALQPELPAPLLPAGSAATHDVGALASFVRNLQVIATLQRDRSAEDWSQVVADIIERFFRVDDSSAASFNRIRSAAQTLQAHCRAANFDESISFAVFRHFLEQELQSKSQGQQYFNGAITFCTLMPMRSLPFKVICMLGMNDDAFPRRMAPCSFDLIAQQPRKGDRNRRNEDRYLFLEALLAARDKLYISYIGHSVVDNSPREPSVLVSELISELAKYPGVSRETLLVQHPLQAFDARYFQKSAAPLFSYAADWLDAARHYQAPLSAKETFDFSLHVQTDAAEYIDIDLVDLTEWAAHPTRFLLRKKLGIELARVQDQVADEENFVIDGLQQYQLAQTAIEGGVRHGLAFEQSLAFARGAGVLPPGVTGDVMLADLDAGMSSFVERVVRTLPAYQRVVDVDLQHERFRLRGRLRQLGEQRRFDSRFSSLKGRFVLPQWILHLLANAYVGPCVSEMLVRDEVIELAALPSTQALDYLARIVDIHHTSTTSVYPVFVDLLWRIAERRAKGDDERKQRAEIAKYYSDDTNAQGIFSDEYELYAFRNREPDSDQVLQLAADLFDGVFSVISRDELTSAEGDE